MVRLFRAVTIVVVLAAGAARSSAQPSVEAASVQAELEEAERLNQQVDKLYADGKYREAVAPAERALAIRERVLGPDHPDVATNLNDLGVLYNEQGAYAKAEPLYVRALDIRERVLGPIHPDVALGLNNLATLYVDQGAYAKAEPLFVRALKIRERAFGPSHPDVAQSLNNLATLRQKQGAYSEAEPLSVRALDIRERAFGPNHPNVALDLHNLADLYRDQGAYSKAWSIRPERPSRSPTGASRHLVELFVDRACMLDAGYEVRTASLATSRPRSRSSPPGRAVVPDGQVRTCLGIRLRQVHE